MPKKRKPSSEKEFDYTPKEGFEEEAKNGYAALTYLAEERTITDALELAHKRALVWEGIGQDKKAWAVFSKHNPHANWMRLVVVQFRFNRPGMLSACRAYTEEGPPDFMGIPEFIDFLYRED